MGISYFLSGKIKRVLYPEISMTIKGMDEVPEFEEHFKNYCFKWMMIAPGRYNKILVHDFCAVYKGDL